MPHEDGTLTTQEMRDIDNNRRILAKRATQGLLDVLLARGVDRLQPEHLHRALAKAYTAGQDDERKKS